MLDHLFQGTPPPNETIEQRIERILLEESGASHLYPTQTMGELFQERRQALAAAIIRLEIATGHRFCDPCSAIETMKRATVGSVLWGMREAQANPTV